MKRILLALMFAATSTFSFAGAPSGQWPVPVGPIQEMAYTPAATRFSLWSPMADSVRVNIYATAQGKATMRQPLTRQADGTWTAVIREDLNKCFYTFQVEQNGKWLHETPGIFAKAVGVNGQRAQVLDMRTTNPVGWESDRSPACNGAKDIILYEMHHRDMSVDEQSGIRNKGKFLAMTEHGTRNADGMATGIDHLKELGVTHVHILPSYDFGSIDETTGMAIGGGGRDFVSRYNWGYDPVNYNVPEGSYSTDAATPEVRIKEFKEMVMAMHKAGMRVVLDVVYNHVFDLEQSPFQRTAPNYFFRYKDKDGNPVSLPREGRGGASPANGSGCGNETASDMPMMRKYMVESVMYWMKEYHIDGFRFDLMGIHDIETMNAIREAAQSIDPNVFIYGEGWAAEAPAIAADRLAMKANTSQLGGIAAFGDEMRDGLRGSWSGGDESGAFVIGEAGNEESVKFGIVGAIQHPGIDYSKVNYSRAPWAAEPTQMISYVSCHDDMCLADRIKCSWNAKAAKTKGMKKGDAATLQRLQKLAETAVLTSQGVPFIWCGDEIMRDKKGVHNSYASPDSINQIPWANKTTNKEVFDYVSTLVKMRKAHPAFRMGSAELVRKNLSFLPVKKGNVIAYRINGAAVGDAWNDIIVILNSNTKAIKQTVPQGSYTVIATDGTINLDGIRSFNGATITVPAQSAVIVHN